MKKWYKVLEQQVKGNQKDGHIPGATFRPGNTSDTEFAWVNQSDKPARNPYQEEGEDDDAEHPTLGQSEFNMSRNASSTSLRSRSATGDSGPPMQGGVRAAAPRFATGFQQPPLSVHTQVPNNPHGAASPVERPGQSYFSPTVESPMSSRTSGSSGMYPFPRQATPQNGWHEEHNRFTAPAMARTASREGSMMNGYSSLSARSAQRPSLPPMAHQTPQHAAMNQNRMRSASSPDIQNQLNGRRPSLGQGNQPPIPDVPVPPFPAHIVQMKGPINRSQNNSPTNQALSLPVRAATQSPGVQREKLSHQDSYYGRMDSRSQNSTPLSMVTDRRYANGPNGLPIPEPPSPTQLKVKVSFDGNYITLVAGMNITYQILVDRIDAKLGRLQEASIAGGSLRLRYRDEDGDFVTIRSDEDIHIAFSDWKEQQKTQLQHGQVGEIQLFCQAV
jgi:cell division control protein 24